MFDHADAIVSLTANARAELERRGGSAWAAKTEVIPCCVDLAHFDPREGEFRARGRALLGIDDDVPLLLFLGSLGGAYPLAPVAEFFRCWAEGRDDARILFVTRHSPDDVLRNSAIAPLQDRVIVRAAERGEIPQLIAAADAAVSFILPGFCAIASSPTKVGEILAMGVPIAANAGVGDMASMLVDPNASVLLPDLSDASVHHAASIMRSIGSGSRAARALAKRWYSLERGVELYGRIYDSLRASS
jgi:glycosyltransferase involved in cell wall biosynthesis